MKTYGIRVAILFLAAAALLAPGCTKPKDAITLATARMDFGLGELPIDMELWNHNPQAGTLTIKVEPTAPWIVVTPQSVTSAAPPTANGPFDKKTIRVRIDRRTLRKGDHQAEIRFTARGIATQTLVVTAKQAQDPPTDSLRLLEVTPRYRKPYLLDFAFSLATAQDELIVAEPAQFSITARENGIAVGSDTPVFLQRGLARQLKLFLVLDYSLSMQQTAGAIAAMEDAAKNILLPALNEDAQVGVIEFHSHITQFPPRVVTGLTVDKELVRQGINRIQTDFVGGLAGGSRAWDAVVLAAQELDFGVPDQEERVIVLFTDGNDVSSRGTLNDAITAAVDAEISVYTVGFGNNRDELALDALATLTGGALFTAENASELGSAFEEVVQVLNAQYVLRWATLRRTPGQTFTPSFTLSLTGTAQQVSYNVAPVFRINDHAGNELEGQLRFVISDSAQGTTAFLRADYMPPDIRRVRMFVATDVDFTVTGVSAVSDGLVSHWSLVTEDAPELGGVWINFQSNVGPIPYAAFGALLRFDFVDFIEDPAPVFSQVYIDNSIYTAGQTLFVDGFPNDPPAAN
jgi:hypothetical protein